MKPRSTNCNADALTTTPSCQLKTYILIENTQKHLSKYIIQVNIPGPQLLSKLIFLDFMALLLVID